MGFIFTNLPVLAGSCLLVEVFPSFILVNLVGRAKALASYMDLSSY
jgi:hypothetical protein